MNDVCGGSNSFLYNEVTYFMLCAGFSLSS